MSAEQNLVEQLAAIYDKYLLKHDLPDDVCEDGKENMLWVPVRLLKKAKKLTNTLEDYDFEVNSTPPSKSGDTLCGKEGRKHRMKRFGPMVTRCIYPGCTGVC